MSIFCNTQNIKLKATNRRRLFLLQLSALTFLISKKQVRLDTLTRFTKFWKMQLYQLFFNHTKSWKAAKFLWNVSTYFKAQTTINHAILYICKFIEPKFLTINVQPHQHKMCTFFSVIELSWPHIWSLLPLICSLVTCS